MQTVIFRYAEHSIGGGYGVDASTGAKGVDGAAEGEYVRLADHNARVAELEQLAATRNEAIGNLRNELSKAQAQNVQIADSLERVMRERDLAQARIKELEDAQPWMQLIANEEHTQEDKTVLIENQGQWVGIRRGDVVFGVWLDQLGCAVFRKVQAAQVAPAQNGEAEVNQ